MKKELHALTAIFPGYFPDCLQFRKIVRSEAVLILDNRPFRSSGKWTRTAIKTAEGKKYLTVPVWAPEGKQADFRSLQIASQKAWQKKHARSLWVNYKNAPYFEHFWPRLRPVFEEPVEAYLQLFERLWKILLKILAPTPRILWASATAFAGSREEEIALQMKQNHLNTYILEEKALSFFRCQHLKEQGLGCQTVTVTERSYPQQFDGFVPNLSVLDLIFNLGPEAPYFLREATEK